MKPILLYIPISFFESTMVLRPHIEVSPNFPVLPSLIRLGRKESKTLSTYRLDKNGDIVDGESGGGTRGSWWPHSACCIELRIDSISRFFSVLESSHWVTADGSQSFEWVKKRRRDSEAARTPLKLKFVSTKAVSPNISRFRMTMLPLDKLDEIHREQLTCMGLRVCFHSDIGRVLVSSRSFEDGEILIYSRVTHFDVDSDPEVHELLRSDHPSCCYLLVPRLKRLYYNRDTFSLADPIKSGDLWYLVNHSIRPNVEVLLRDGGIQFKAKRNIQPNEPILWTYPPSFFGKDESAVDLPQHVIPDSSVLPRE
jgi:hypothetical protein